MAVTSAKSSRRSSISFSNAVKFITLAISAYEMENLFFPEIIETREDSPEARLEGSN